MLEELSTFSYSVPVLHLSVGLGFATAENCVNIISPIKKKLHCHVFYVYIIISTIFFFGQRQTN